MLAFPSNDFRQELESNQEIHSFLEQHFPDTNFPVFGISSLSNNPVYQQLRRQLPTQKVQHNFFKYLVDRRGIAQRLYPKSREPQTLEQDIENLLSEATNLQQQQKQQPVVSKS